MKFVLGEVYMAAFTRVLDATAFGKPAPPISNTFCRLMQPFTRWMLT